MSKVVKSIVSVFTGKSDAEEKAKKQEAANRAEQERQDALNKSRANIEKTKEARAGLREQRVAAGSIIGGVGGNAPAAGQGILAYAPNEEGSNLTYAQERAEPAQGGIGSSPLPAGGQSKIEE